MNSKPEITVLIPAKNAENTIEVALQDALMQEKVKVQIIVANDSSEDGTANIVQEYIESGNPIRMIQVPSPGGIVAGRNLLLEACDTEYFAWLDADDGWNRKDKLYRQIQFLEKRPLFALVGDAKVRGIFTDTFKQKWYRFPRENEDIQVRLHFKNAFINSSIVGRTPLVKSFSFDPDFEYLEDYLWVSEVAKHHPVGNTTLASTVHFIHPKTIQNEKDNKYEVYRKEALLLQKRLFNYSMEIPKDQAYLLSYFCRRNKALNRNQYRQLLSLLKRVSLGLQSAGFSKSSVDGFFFDVKLRALKCRYLLKNK